MHLALLLAILASAHVTVEPPPGWTDVTASKGGRNVVASLKGPETSSFVLTRIEAVSFENRAAVRGLLHDVLAEMESRMKLGLRPTSNLVTSTFGSGLTAHYIRAEGKDKEKNKLILAVTQAQGETMLGVLVSAVPDTILPSLLAGVKATAAGSLESVDGQLDFAASGLTARALNARESKGGFVAALQRGPATEVLILRLNDDGTPIADQAALVKQTVIAIPGATAGKVSDVARVETEAGPGGVYAAAGPAAAGYLPWAYWGYSILAKGPQAEDALIDALETVKRGPGADAKLVDATPRVPLRQGPPRWLFAAGALCLLAGAGYWWRSRNSLA